MGNENIKPKPNKKEEDKEKDDSEIESEEENEEKNDLEKSYISVDLINPTNETKFNLDIIWIDEKVFNSENSFYFEELKYKYPNIKINLFINLEEVLILY